MGVGLVASEEQADQPKERGPRAHIAELLIPKARVGALVGEAGRTKRRIEDELDCRIKVDEEGGVEIRCRDPLLLLRAKLVIQAIGRGFSTEDALLLVDESFMLEVINIEEEVGKKGLERMRGRLIGREGSTRKKIEETTDTKLAIYGKTVSIIGKRKDIIAARRAIDSILGGATHGAAYAMMERREKRKGEDTGESDNKI